MAPSWLALPGNFTLVSSAPERCTACNSKHLYQQSDFKKSIGLFCVGVACVFSLVFNYLKLNWFLTWSPMVAVLLIDRLFAWSRPLLVICYECEHLHRGLTKEQCLKYPTFDLEVHDRLKYKAETVS